MRPKALQTRQHIAILRQFDLSFGIGRLGTHGKDVENQTRTVQNLHFQCLLDIAELLGREFVIENNHTHLALLLFFLLNKGADFLQLTLTDIGY